MAGPIKRHFEVLSLLVILVAVTIGVVATIADYGPSPSAGVAAGAYTYIAVKATMLIGFAIFIAVLLIILVQAVSRASRISRT